MSEGRKRFARHMAQTQMNLKPFKKDAGNLFSERTNTDNAKKHNLFPSRLAIHDWIDHTFFGRMVNAHADFANNGNLEFNQEIKNHHLFSYADKNRKAIMEFDVKEAGSELPIDYEPYLDTESSGVEKYMAHLKLSEIKHLQLLLDQREANNNKFTDYQSQRSTEENGKKIPPKFNPFNNKFKSLNLEIGEYCSDLKEKIRSRETALLIYSAKAEEILIPWIIKSLQAILKGEEIPDIDEATMQNSFNFSRRRSELLEQYSQFTEVQLSEYRQALALKRQKCYTLAETVFELYAGDEEQKKSLQDEIQKIYNELNPELPI
jgi:hypothetical protein